MNKSSIKPSRISLQEPPVSIILHENHRRSSESTMLHVPRCLTVTKVPDYLSSDHGVRARASSKLDQARQIEKKMKTAAAVDIQTFWRRVHAENGEKTKRNKAIEATIKIQAMIRRFIRTKRTKQAVLTIQALMRGYLLRANIVELIFQFNQMIHDTAMKQKKKQNQRVRFDDSKTSRYPDRYSQRERNNLYYKSQDLQSFRSEARNTFMEWYLKMNSYENQSFTCNSLHEGDGHKNCIRGLEHYYREHQDSERYQRTIPQRVVQFHKYLEATRTRNGSGDDPIQQLADFYAQLSEEAISQFRHNAVEDEKVAKIVYHQTSTKNKRPIDKSPVSRFFSHFSPRVSPKSPKLKMQKKGFFSPFKSPTDAKTSFFSRNDVSSKAEQTQASSTETAASRVLSVGAAHGNSLPGRRGLPPPAPFIDDN